MVLEENDWEHVVTETRAGKNSLNDGKPSSAADAFEVDGTKVTFEIQ